MIRIAMALIGGAALLVTVPAQAAAHPRVVDYIGHPRLVARVETRRLERMYARPGVWQGATVQVECTQLRRLADDCQATIQPPNSETSFWIDGTAHIASSGRSFRMVWS
jgi:hypothetical protein